MKSLQIPQKLVHEKSKETCKSNNRDLNHDWVI